jgi:hypothetical protein
VLAFASLPASAILGDSAASVLADQARMKGSLRSVDMKAYVMHEITAEGTVGTPGLVVQQSGHPRSFHGQAYIPQLLPQDVKASDIR